MSVFSAEIVILSMFVDFMTNEVLKFATVC